MKQIRTLNRFILITTIGLIFYSCMNENKNNSKLNGQLKEPKKSIPIEEFEFESIFGIHRKDSSSLYSLLGEGYFKAPHSDNVDSIITSWIASHPNAVVMPITSYISPDEDSLKAQMIYCWIISNNDTLNNLLIKKGGYPGGTMMRSKTWQEMSNLEKDFYDNSEDNYDFQLLIDNKDFDSFIEQIKQAEKYARQNKLGIWASDSIE